MGFDPQTGQIHNEIPGVYYAGPNAEPEGLTVPDLDGTWTLYATGNATGSYTLDAQFVDAENPSNEVIVKQTAPGVTDIYRISISPAPDQRMVIGSSDVTAPVAAASLSPQPNAAGWNNSNATVGLKATDNAGGSGVQQITYSASGAQTIPSTTVAGATTTLPAISAEGTTTITYFATDNAGNAEAPRTTTIRLDKTAPTTNVALTGKAGSSGWYVGPVTVTLGPADQAGGSGVASTHYSTDGGATWQPYTAPLSFPNDGNHSLLFRSTDSAGNVETAQTVAFKVDQTSPTVAYNGNAGTYRLVDQVTITCTANDTLSGVASSTCANITGPAYSFNSGVNTFAATATDNAGNAGNGTASFTITATYDDLCALSKQFVTNAGIQQSEAMCAQLNAAKQAAARGNQMAKDNAIAAYNDAIDAAVKGKFLTAERAAILKKWAATL